MQIGYYYFVACFESKWIRVNAGLEFQRAFWGLCHSLGIDIQQASTEHPRSDTQVEHFNKEIKRLSINMQLPNQMHSGKTGSLMFLFCFEWWLQKHMVTRLLPWSTSKIHSNLNTLVYCSPSVRIFVKLSIRFDFYHVYSTTIANNCILYVQPNLLYIYIYISTPNNKSYRITRMQLDYFYITILIAKLLTVPIV